MEKTTFAGLTVLEADESLIEDGGAFIGRDRDIIDFHLERGSKTHRHTGLSGLDNPSGAASADVVSSGGTIRGDLTMVLGYTLQDDERGETILAPTIAVATPGPLEPPQDAPTAVANYASGTLTVDDYHYGLTYIDGDGGETPLGPSVTVTREPGYPNGRVLLSGLDDGMAAASAVGWRLYRARGGGDFAYLAEGTGDTYTDNGSTSPICDQQPPNDNINTTNAVNTLLVHIPNNAQIQAADFINVYLSEDGEFNGSVLLEQFPVASAGRTALYRSLELSDQQPPDVSTSVGGAPKIDPDTELLDWHWLRPVDELGDLPDDAEQGDVRVVLANDTAYVFNAAGEWETFSGGGLVIGSGAIGLGEVDEFLGSSLSDEWIAPMEPDQAGLDDAVVSGGELTAPTGTPPLVIVRGDFEDGVCVVKAESPTNDDQIAAVIKSNGLYESGSGDLTFLVLLLEPSNSLLTSPGLHKFTVGGGLEELETISNQNIPTGTYWLRLEADGNLITYGVYDEEPGPGVEPVCEDTYTLTGGDATTFGAGVSGGAGLWISDPSSADRWSFNDGSSPGYAGIDAESLVVPPEDFQLEDLGDGAVQVTLAQYRALVGTGMIPSAAASAVAITHENLGNANDLVISAEVEQPGVTTQAGLEVKRISERSATRTKIVVYNSGVAAASGITHLIVTRPTE